MKKIRSLIDKRLSKLAKTLHVMKKARKKVEGPTIGIKRHKKKKVNSYGVTIARKKEGKHVSIGMIQKRTSMN